jgi:hypothetical protein
MCCREQILSMKDDSKSTVVDALSMMPCDLAADDISDFCPLAQYYAAKTPISFHRVSCYFSLLHASRRNCYKWLLLTAQHRQIQEERGGRGRLGSLVLYP